MSNLDQPIPPVPLEPAKPPKTPKPKMMVHPPNEPDTITDFAQRWFDHFQAATKRHNPCYFHSCCFSFSTQYLRDKLGHIAYPNYITWPQFRKLYKVKDVKTFEAALETIARKLPNSSNRCPTYNKPHHNLLEEIRELKQGPNLQYQIFEQEVEIDRLQDKQAQMTQEIQSLKLKTQTQEAELNKLRYFLKVQGIDPSMLAEGQNPTSNEMLQKHAPQDLEWPEYLPPYPTPGIFHPLFKEVKEKVNEFRWGSEVEVARLMAEKDPRELDRLVQAGLTKPVKAKPVRQMKAPEPSERISWMQSLLEPLL